MHTLLSQLRSTFLEGRREFSVWQGCRCTPMPPGRCDGADSRTNRRCDGIFWRATRFRDGERPVRNMNTPTGGQPPLPLSLRHLKGQGRPGGGAGITTSSIDLTVLRKFLNRATSTPTGGSSRRVRPRSRSEIIFNTWERPDLDDVKNRLFGESSAQWQPLESAKRNALAPGIDCFKSYEIRRRTLRSEKNGVETIL